ncbi:uncharacterized protein LOC105287033 isoform X2 [Ooceraea biroi]|uniref:uncharacterized protein LOC105287033 isoform X2 n=1 Tax=Ooceraea biroi TaxID=2015173 RepID=UPI0005B7D180|nr:uncharacterized protein LOC105287033 isoform X2 [Ooceraea biroi]XP_011350721.1 uncharacterized protein LOC105287033 isoform X2 [Ooceraea biroi]
MCTIMLAIKLAILHHQLGDFWLRNACRWRHTTIFILGTLTEHSRQPDSESPLSLANRRSEHACRTIRAVNPRGEQFHTTNGFVHKSLDIPIFRKKTSSDYTLDKRNARTGGKSNLIIVFYWP